MAVNHLNEIEDTTKLEPKLAVATLVTNRKDLILVGFHEATKTWGLPGGKVEVGEHPNDAVRRETEEETGLTTLGYGRVPQYITVTSYAKTCWTVLIYQAGFTSNEEKPKDMEKDKIHSWRWVPFQLDQLPRPLIGPFAAIFEPGRIRKGHLY